MSEGELKKRIAERANDWSSEYTVRRLVEKDLNEAAKEFINIHPFDEDYPHWDREIGDLAEDLRDLTIWFKKYFGETK